MYKYYSKIYLNLKKEIVLLSVCNSNVLYYCIHFHYLNIRRMIYYNLNYNLL